MARLAAVIPIAIDYKVKTDAFVDDDTFIFYKMLWKTPH
jgi:hypothetical protein